MVGENRSHQAGVGGDHGHHVLLLEERIQRLVAGGEDRDVLQAGEGIVEVALIAEEACMSSIMRQSNQSCRRERASLGRFRSRSTHH